MLQTLSPNDILNIWEQGFSRHPIDRALTIILYSYPDITFEEITKFNILKRDICLLDIYKKNFGSLLRCFSTCPSCKENLEFEIASEDILSKQNEIKEKYLINFTVNDININLRLPNSLDLASVALYENAVMSRNELIKRCVTEARNENKAFSRSEITQEIIDAVSEYMDGYEHNGEIDFELKCNACGHEWQMPFDILVFLWKEISSHAKRLLYEIHAIASAYGWREEDILSMSPARRRFYLEMVS
jgi:hypothetical protein